MGIILGKAMNSVRNIHHVHSVVSSHTPVSLSDTPLSSSPQVLATSLPMDSQKGITPTPEIRPWWTVQKCLLRQDSSASCLDLEKPKKLVMSRSSHDSYKIQLNYLENDPQPTL